VRPSPGRFRDSRSVGLLRPQLPSISMNNYLLQVAANDRAIDMLLLPCISIKVGHKVGHRLFCINAIIAFGLGLTPPFTSGKKILVH
jgi:hypothetical protein